LVAKVTDQPKVSVLMITYNHESFIAQAIDSVLMQETVFPIELVIGEDCSKDRTREIVLEYQRRFPETIRLLLPVENLGANRNLVQTYEACRGEYIALLEGDDYWTDPHKLQKQVEFLEGHPDYVICHHDAIVVNEHRDLLMESPLPVTFKRDYSEKELITGAWILTLTTCFRNILTDTPPELTRVYNGDTFLFSLLGNHGKSKYLGDIIRPDAYRIHSGGVWSSIPDDAIKAFHRITTFYWLRKYYWRLGKFESALLCGRLLPNQMDCYRLSSIDQVEAQLSRHLRLLETELESICLKGEEIPHFRDSISSTLFMRAAFANFKWQCWSRGCNYLQRAVELDPVIWRDENALETLIVNQLSTIFDINHIFEPVEVNEFVNNLFKFMPNFQWSKGLFKSVSSQVNAEFAYRSYLNKDSRRVRTFTKYAIVADPNLLKNKGLLRRSLNI
jgi:glycosyltransferase involved in cell wall biosynthesis